jgi:hypothetical protein
MRDPIHTAVYEVMYTHAYMHADITNTSRVHDLHSNAQRNSIYHVLMRAGYVLHSLECLECGVVGKCCSNVLRSLLAYGVPIKAVRTCVREKSDTAHVRSSQCAIPFTQPCTRSYTPMHTCMPTYQIQARVHALHVYVAAFQCTTQ